MEECAKIQSQRNLSLKGKTIVINALISSKLWFIANVFPIPKDLIPEINKIIFGYLWKRSAAEPIAWETLFLPRDRGGLRILVPLIQGQALRIKYLMQLGKKENNNIWTYLGRYWVSSKIHEIASEMKWNSIRQEILP